MRARPRSRGLVLSLGIGIISGFVLPTATLVVTTAGNDPPWDPFPRRPGATWVAIDPVQCLDNPWEEDWLVAHNGSFFYPREWEAQRRIIVDYYARLGIRVLELKRELMEGRVICGACSCSAGYTLYLLVANEDLNQIIAQGFRIVP